MQRSKITTILLSTVLLAAGPTTKPIRGIADVESLYQDRIAASTKVYRMAMEDAAEERLRNLHALEDRALQNQDVDTATIMREKIKAAEDGEVEAKRMSASERQDEINWLQHRLEGTLWHWGDDFIRFEPDGNVANFNWSSRGLETHWKVIDVRSVLLIITKGKRSDLYGVLTFDPKADSYTGWAFENQKQLPVNKQQIETK